MRARERVIASRLLEMISENQEYAQSIGVSTVMKKAKHVPDVFESIDLKTGKNSDLKAKAHI